MERAEAQVSERVRSLLAERKISDSELARRLNLSQSYFSRRMRGDVAWRTTDLARIAAALHVEVTDLLRTDEPAASVTP
jgi:transcriptional regulator with XRE-family HTH domain